MTEEDIYLRLAREHLNPKADFKDFVRCCDRQTATFSSDGQTYIFLRGGSDKIISIRKKFLGGGSRDFADFKSGVGGVC